MKIKEIIPEYEATTGKRVSPFVARFAEQMDIVGQRFNIKGYEDAAQGKPVPAENVFQMWGKKLFEDDSTMAEALAILAQLYYMDGYEARMKRGQTEVPA